MQRLGVQGAQVRVGILDVVHVLQSPVQTAQHREAVISDPFVVPDGLCIVEIAEATKIPLSPGVDDETPARG